MSTPARLAVILGPTASGKSALAIALAQQLKGEVVVCDSTQVYRRFNIGTAKVPPAEQKGIPHWMMDLVEPHEVFTAGDYRRRAEATLREIGIRRGRRGARKRPQVGWRSLTPTELTVAGLVAEGLSNPRIGERLYISRRTVQAHLAHVFAKLDISARAQLAAEVTRQRSDPPR